MMKASNLSLVSTSHADDAAWLARLPASFAARDAAVLDALRAFAAIGGLAGLNRTKAAKRIMEHLDVNPERLRLEWVSASEGDRFAEVVNEMTEEIRALGPLSLQVHRDLRQAIAQH